MATTSVSVYSKPSDKSTILYQRYRDELVNIYEEIVSEYGPGYNPVWYRVWRGYIHSAHLQRVKILTNPVVENSQIPEKRGRLAEVTVPMTQRCVIWPTKNMGTVVPAVLWFDPLG